MAEATGLRNNALPYPVYGAPWTVVFPMLDADGDLVTGATTPDAEVSKNGDTFADCTNESTEIATNSGMYYLSLTATEMTADIVAVIAKSATAGMKTTALTLYPAKLVSLRAGTVGANAADGSTLQLDSSASAVDDFYNGCLLVGTLDSNVEARIITDYAGSTKVCSVTPNFVTTPDNNDTFVVYQPLGRQFADANAMAWNGTAVASPHTAGYPVVTIKDGTGTGEIDTTSGGVLVAAIANNAITAAAIATGAIDADAIADNAIDAGAIAADAITAAKIANGAIDAATFAADVDAEILSYIVDDATRIDASALNTLSGHDPGETIMGATDLGTGSGLTSLATAAELAKVPKSDGAATWNNTALASIQSEANDALVANNLDHLVLSAVDTNFATTVHADSVIGQLADNGAGFDRSTDSLEAIRDNIGTAGAGLTAADDAVITLIGAAGAGLTALATQASVDALPRLAEFFTIDSGEAYGDAVAGSVVKEIADNAGGSSLTASDIADEVQTRTIAAVTVVNGLAADTITNTALAGSAVTEIQAGLATAAELAKVPKSDGTATWNATALGSIQSEANDALVAYDPPTRTEATSDKDEILTAVGDVPTNAELTTALGTADDAVLAQIALVKAKTDSLTFTVANVVDAHIKYVAGEEVTGAGTAGDPWGPA